MDAGFASLPVVLGLATVIGGSALLRGFTGFGFGLAAVPLMGFLVGPAEAVVVALGLQFVGGLSDTVRTRRISHWGSLRWLMVGALIGSPLGTLALATVSPATARLLIASVCLSAVLLLALGRSFAAHPRRLTTSAVGVVAGVFNGLAAMPGPPVVAYYMALPMEATVSRASLVTFFTATAGLALASTLFAGLWTAREIVLVALGLPVMLVGTMAGEALFRHAGARGHRRVALVVLAAIALVSGVQGWLSL